MKNLHLAFLLLALITTSGCSRQTFILDETSHRDARRATADDMQDFFIEGLGQEKTIYVSDICRENEKVVKVEVQETALDAIIHMITAPFYTPRHARVYCAKK